MEETVEHLSDDLLSGELEEIAQFIVRYGFAISLMTCVLFLILGLVGVISNSMLLHGVKKGKGDLFMFWLVWEGIDLVLFIVFWGWDFIDDIRYNEQVSGITIIDWACFLVIALVAGFMWTVVNSYRKVLARTREQEVQQGVDY